MTDTRGEFQYQLAGFSGCTIEVRRLGDQTLVRKTAQNPEFNKKLIREVGKLIELAEIGADSMLFRTPAVLRCGENTDGQSFYDIEFVPSWQLDFRIPELYPKQIIQIVERINDTIEIFSTRGNPPQRPVATGTQHASQEISYIRGKFREALDTFESGQTNCDRARSLISEFADRVEGLRIPSQCVLGTQTFCHGDMALDNVLIGRDDQLFLIDPLVNGHESFMWDISKVLQSTYTQWRQIKTNSFSIDETFNKIVVQTHTRMSLFNTRFIELVTAKYHPGAIMLYLAATLARTAKYWQTCNQLCALLMLTNEFREVPP